MDHVDGRRSSLLDADTHEAVDLTSLALPTESDQASGCCCLKRSLPTVVCLVMLGAAKAIQCCVSKCCWSLFRRFSRPSRSMLDSFPPPPAPVPEADVGDVEVQRQSAADLSDMVGLQQEPNCAMPQAANCIAGFYLHDWQLPPGLGDRDLEAMVWEVHRLCSSTGPISMQQALRLVLGMAYNIEAAVAKWREVAAWREEQRMALVRERLDAMMRSNADISFPHEQEVYGKLFRGCPCALLTADGRPVSVWHAGAPRADELSSLPVEHLKEWSREVFEYADLWISKDTERTRQLTGYIQVYNMAGLGWRQVTSKEVAEKLKGALSAGGFYVEAVARIYVVNAPRVFSMAWKMVRGFLSPWTASKITVSSEVPQELIAELGGEASAAKLRRLCAADVAAPLGAPVLRPEHPRRASEESSVSNSSCSTRCSYGCPKGAVKVAGFWLQPQQLPPGLEDRNLEALVEEVHKACCTVAPASKQQALRLVLGMGYNPHAAVAKWREVVEWRRAHRMDDIRQNYVAIMLSNGAAQFPNQAEVYDKLVAVSPCAFLSTSGCPVSIWHAGTLNVNDATTLPLDQVSEWSRAVFEYKDIWISQQSEKSRRLVGYVQVYDMRGLTWRHYSSRELAEKVKAALQPGGFYVEAVSHMFVIHASPLFAAAWKIARNLISPWTASKISVSGGVPDELFQLLGGPSSETAQRFQDLLRRTPGEAAAQTRVLQPTWKAQAGPELASTPTAELSSESCKADISDCPSRCEEADLEVPEGMRKAAGFLLAEDQLPPGLESHCLDALVAEVHQMCSQVSALTQQQALRLVLGMGYDRVAAVAKWREICAWRAANNMDEVRREQARKAASTEDIHFPGEDKVRKFIMVHPCALLAADGSPVSIWHGGTLASGMDLEPADITAWSHAVFEYKDLWVAQDSEATRTLKGYIQVYDLKDVSLRQLSRDTVEKLRCALQPGSYYMEAVSHMYVVNSSMVFSMAWKVIRNLISPWTASKISVSNGLPEELVQALGGPQSAALKRLKEILASRSDAGPVPVLRRLPDA
ncbi:unnamed protein product [Effrenium voratum]|nr:unnamed protein product [Effrenium voratum]